MSTKILARAISAAVVVVCVCGIAAQAQLNVLSVDCAPFTPPLPPTSYGSNTMGMSLQQVDPGAVLFNVTEVTPPAFRALTAAQLAAYDLIAIHNNPTQLSDNCDGLPPGGLGTTWHSVIGINSGGRVFLCSHDTARFKITIPPFATPFGMPGGPCPGCEPFAADDIIKQAALWAGGGSRTGLMIFNDSARFFSVPGAGWNNPELNLPAAWNITDSPQTGVPANPTDGGYTKIMPAYVGHPIYLGLTDQRLQPNSVSTFAANIADGSYHSVFATYEAGIFQKTEEIVNAGIIDVGGFNAMYGFGSNTSVVGPDQLAISLIRDESPAVPFNTGLGLIALAVLFVAALATVLAINRRKAAKGVA